MPAYPFECPDCGYYIEFVTSVSEYTEVMDKSGGLTCPKCSTVMECSFKGCRPGLIFKGGGFPSKDIKAQNEYEKAKSPSGDKHRKKMQARYKKRNDRINAMPKEQQQGLAAFGRKYGVKRGAW